MRKVVVHWSSFGPFHLARLNAAFCELDSFGIELVGLEVTAHKKLFAWDRDESPTLFRRYIACPSHTFEDLSPRQKWRGMASLLAVINPDVVAINGYSDFDAWSALTWCKLNGRGAIIMSDSTRNWTPRSFHKELVKKWILRNYNSALCAGSASRGYLELLGMCPTVIFEGLDAVNNDYFSHTAMQARRDPLRYKTLPGLESSVPFFLSSSRISTEKNLDGLIHSYAMYRLCISALRLTPWRLVILGDGSARKELEQFVQAQKIEDVTFAGFRQIDETPGYYGLAAAFIHPTFKDTWGLVVNEAMASGLPVLVSRAAGCAPDLVEEGKNGFTFAPHDLKTLTSLMVRMSAEQTNLEKMGLTSQARISCWGVERFASGLHAATKLAMQ